MMYCMRWLCVLVLLVALALADSLRSLAHLLTCALADLRTC